jgi:DNA-3-methyladenine glycosylase
MSTSATSHTLCKKLKRKLDHDDDFTMRWKEKKLSPSPGPTNGDTDSRCDAAFFDSPCKELAKDLLGCALFRVVEGDVCWGRVVETEAYLGWEDKAAHSYNGRRTERNEATYMPPGTAYVFSIYGMHHCFNISSRGDGAAVLIRALEPLGGVADMRARRKAVKKDRDLCNGPGKLCKALDIDKGCDRVDLVTSQLVWVEHLEGVEPGWEVVESRRIGVDYAEEWADRPLRFHLKNSPHVSKQ